MIEGYLKLQMALDDEYYSVVIEAYYRDTKLSFLLANVCLTAGIPGREIVKWDSSESINHEDLFLANTGFSASHLINHFDMILQYLRSPWRSRQYSMKASGGRLYSNALLYCLLPHDRKPHMTYITGRLDTYILLQYLKFPPHDQRDSQILSKWTQSGPRDSHKYGSGSVTNTAMRPSNYLESLQTHYKDDPSMPRYFDSWKILPIVIHFFPRAGRCDKLLDLCMTKYVPKNALCPEDEEIVFRAMEAYVDRWKDGESGSPEIDERAYPFPLVERRVSIFTKEEKEAILKLRAQSSK